MRRGALKSAVEGFLGRFVSRNADYDGYWLPGFLVSAPGTIEIDLLQDSERVDTPAAFASGFAARCFADQVGKQRIGRENIRSAVLVLTVPATIVWGCRGEFYADGHQVTFDVHVVGARGVEVRGSRSAFVAPHDPRRESRRAAPHRVDPTRPAAP